MSLFGMMGMGGMMGDMDDDLFSNHMNAMNMQMRSMNRMMNSLMPDPFNMLTPFDPGFQQNALMDRRGPPHMGGLFGFPVMPNMNRLLSADIASPPGASFCSSSVISMSAGPDGRPQIYQETSSTKTGPGGVRETRKTVEDSTRGVKKMAIGHHIGDRAHIIEKEQDLRSGQLEERQEFFNLDEEQAEDFDREFTNKANMGTRPRQAAIQAAPQTLTIEPLDDDDDDEVELQNEQQPSRHQQHRRHLPPTPPRQPQQQQQNSLSSTSTSSPSSSATLPPNASATTTTNNVDHHPHLHHYYNNNNYLNATPRRAHRSSHHLVAGGVAPRRPLRTPSSSPLATTPIVTLPHGIATSPRDWPLYNPRFYRK